MMSLAWNTTLQELSFRRTWIGNLRLWAYAGTREISPVRLHGSLMVGRAVCVARHFSGCASTRLFREPGLWDTTDWSSSLD